MAVDFQPTEEQTALRDTLHDFAETVIRPQARACETARATSGDIAEAAHEIGVTAPVSETHGGGGSVDAVTYCIAAEELAWGNPGIAYQLLGSGIAAIVIEQSGTDELKARYMPAFVESRPPATFTALGEKVAAGDLGALQTRIDGDKVVGDKYGVLNAPEAPFGIAVGRGPGGLGAVVVEAGSYEIVRPEDKMGLEAAPTCVVRFDTAGAALPPGRPLELAILWTKLLGGAIAVGAARAAFEHAARYAVEREAFGKPIGAFQGISFKIADMATAVDAARLAIWHAAWRIDRNEATLADVAEANSHALAAAVACGDDSVQILGGHGYIKDHPVEMWFRDSVTLSVFDAPDVLGDALVGAAAGS